MAVRSAMTYGLKTASLSNKQEPDLETAKLKVLTIINGSVANIKIRNEYIWGQQG